jgi:Chain length determinant protein.
MDSQQLKELFFALKLELVRYKSWCLAGFIVICCLVLAIGHTWPQTYETSATLYADQTNIIEPLLRGRAQVTDIDGAKSAKDIIYTRKFLEEVIKESNLLQPGASPEVLEQKVKYLRGTIHIESVGNEYFKVLFASNDPDRTYDILVATIQSFISYTTRQKKKKAMGLTSLLIRRCRLIRSNWKMLKSA